jgi:DNA-binding transcriptional LysR family regulator
MEFNNLRIFSVVAETGSVSRAATELHYVQSNVTARIQRLEEDLGAQLFVRSRQGMTLTYAGEVLMEYATRAQQLVQEARAAVASTQGLAGTLRLGSLETTLAVRLSKALSDFNRDHKNVELRITTGTTDQLMEAVLALRIDGAFVAGPVSHPVIEQRLAFVEDIVLVTPVDVPDIQAWKTRTLIVFRHGCAYRALAEQWLRSTGIAPVRLLELGSLEGILACVGAGLGVTLLPRSAVEHHRSPEDIRLHSLDKPHSEIIIGLIRHRDAPHHASLNVFFELATAGH